MVLDEPNSNLDDAGEAALIQAVRQLKAQGTTVVVITHRTNIIAAVDKILLLVDGAVQMFAPRDQVLQSLQQKAAGAAAAPQAPAGGLQMPMPPGLQMQAAKA